MGKSYSFEINIELFSFTPGASQSFTILNIDIVGS